MLKTAAFEAVSFWRELAASGAELSSKDLREWGDALDVAVAELNGAARAIVDFPPALGSSQAVRAELAIEMASERLAEDIRAYTTRFTAAMAALEPRIAANIAELAQWEADAARVVEALRAGASLPDGDAARVAAEWRRLTVEGKALDGELRPLCRGRR